MATKTVGATGRNYATIALWESYLDGGGNSGSAGVLGEAEIGECYNDTEFDETVTFSGYTTSAANTVTLRPATGQGFRDAPSAALAYSQTNGVAWKRGGVSFVNTCTVSVDYVTIFGMQIKGTSAYIGFAVSQGASTSHGKVDSCILTHTAKSTIAQSSNGPLINCLLYADSTSTSAMVSLPSFNAASIYGCTIARTSNNAAGGTAISDAGYGFAGTIKNCAIFGFTTTWGPDATWASQTYCATDQASFPAAVTGGVTSLTFTSQFADSDNVGTDFKALATGGLKAGTPDATNTPVDIFGTTRDATTPYIGCYEVLSVASSAPSFVVGQTRTASRMVGSQAQRFAFRQPTTLFRVDATQTASYTASGGIIFAGTAAVARVAARLASGGIVFSGAANVLRNRVLTAAGGLVFAGTAAMARVAARLASGGIIFGGSAASSRNAVYQVVGGLVFSGAAAAARVASRVAAGGVVFGGAAAAAFHEAARIVQAAGGIVFGGAATVSFVGQRLSEWFVRNRRRRRS